ncbi:leucyl aminopeptidase [Kineosporiaceae bacterium SCSIO 59966]|nr:leucyl aminopeptidase [Kineosporiaceae bacterium SCSIO 59966]
MPTLSPTGKDLRSVKADALVVATAATPEGPVLLGADALPRGLRSALSSLSALGVSGKADEVHRVPSGGQVAAPVVVLTGTGSLAGDEAPSLEALRRAAGAAVRELAGTPTVAVALPADDVATATAVAEGALLGAYAYRAYRARTADRHKEPVATVHLVTPRYRDRHLKAAIERAHVVAEAVAATRDLVNCPPADLYPAEFARRAQDQAKGAPVKVTVLDDKQLAAGGYGGILGVGQGSSRPPRLVKVAYHPRGAARHVALVGKGITFDSGGLSIKPAQGMETMKLDMAGAAVVLETVLAVARLGLPVRVTGWMALAENMPSGTAQRPSDVLTTYGGRTVEVLNTDAEGRLVLADAIVAAGEENPDAIIDIATLTGAQMVALGNRVSAVIGSDDALVADVRAAADAAGEQFWPMPLPEELRASLDSQVADIANIGDRFGGMLVAGLFLREFVPTTEDGRRLPWAHLDIAGPAFNESAPWGYTGKGGTGVGVRTLVTLLEDVASAR